MTVAVAQRQKQIKIVFFSTLSNSEGNSMLDCVLLLHL